MNPVGEVMDLLGEWRRLTLVETSAIGDEDWGRLAELRPRKDILRAQITAAVGQMRSGAFCDAATLAQTERRLAATAAGLAALSRQNRGLIQAKRQAAQARMDYFAAAASNLRGVRRAYGGLCPQLWHSYS